MIVSSHAVRFGRAMNMMRYFSSAAEKSVHNSALAKLRRKTGFSVMNCRKALNSFDNDLERAEEWLRAEAKSLGWKTAETLQMREVPEGLVAVTKAKKKGVMVEVNCETDFVAKNEGFQSLVQSVASACLKVPVLQTGSLLNKVFLNEQQLADLGIENEKLSEYVIKNIALFRENIVLKRAVCYETTSDEVELVLGIHPAMEKNETILFGKYGSIVALKMHKNDTKVDTDAIQHFGKDLCTHIIGMNPIKVGNPEDDVNNAEEETALIHQDFLHNPDLTVGEILREHGADVLDFERFECGEDSCKDKS